MKTDLNSTATPPRSPKDNLPKSTAERMKTATISDNTRSYLILFGKADDLYSEIYNCIDRDYGDAQADKIADGIYTNGISLVRNKLLGLVTDSIINSMSDPDWRDI